ncbi:MAG: OAM dimerization domain-containing protein [Elusimicrobiaceae bacterium]
MMIKPYGDTLNDGAMQLSFTLPVKCGGKAKEAARLFVLKLGFKSCEIVNASPLSGEFTFFVAYARTDAGIDYDRVEYAEAVENCMNMAQVDEFIKTNFGRKIVVIGACTGTDAHTVGIDAIMNMKGYNHHFGLERYAMIEAYNLGAQVPNEKLIAFAREKKADAILVSQIVTQKDVHVQNLTELVELLEAENVRGQFVAVVGGPRINNKLAMELGFDAGFGSGTFAEHVATFIVRTMQNRMKNK